MKSELHPSEIVDRPDQFATAMRKIYEIEYLVWLKGGKYELSLAKDDNRIIDADVVQAMKGGAERMFEDLCDLGAKPLAQRIRADVLPDVYYPIKRSLRNHIAKNGDY